MTDAATVWTDLGLDLELEGGDLVGDGGLTSAVLLSLFSDARDEEASLLDGSDPRGWWAEEPGDPYGSLLWLLEREKRTQETLEAALEAARAALAWVVEDELVEEVRVDGEYTAEGHLALDVVLVRGRARVGADLWAATAAELDLAVGPVRLSLEAA